MFLDHYNKQVGRNTLTRQERISHIKSSFSKFLQTPLNDDYITSLSLSIPNSSITFSCDMDFHGFKDCSLIIPESTLGEYTLCFGSEIEVFKGKNVYEVMGKVVRFIERKRNEVLKEYATPGSKGNGEIPDFLKDDDKMDLDDDDDIDVDMEGGFSDEMEFEVEIDDEDFGEMDVGLENNRKKQMNDMINKLVNEVSSKKKGIFAKMGASGIDNYRIYIFLEPSIRIQISKMIANCWCIDLSKYIVIALTFTSYLLDTTIIPEIESFQCGWVGSDPTDNPVVLENRTKYGLYWTVCDRLKTHLKKNPISKDGKILNQNFIKNIAKFSERVIKSSPYYCLICGEQMVYVGIKPSICSNPLCVFSHEEYGLGCDLESEILKNPDIIDLLITTTAAACSSPNMNRYNPFDPYPFGLEVKQKVAGKIVVSSFTKGKNVKCNSAVLHVINNIPPIGTLQKMVKKNILKKSLNKLDVRMYGLIRWIISSNRAHLHRIAKKDLIKNLNTTHQFILMSGSVEKENEFQELKKKYGSVQAWHGSPLYNWHSILRIGLKNMSGKKGQLHGAAHGSGVYFAPNISTSLGYMIFHPSWVNSKFQNQQLGMMALCEIIKHPKYSKMPNPFYVIPDERHITTRLFLIFTNSAGNRDYNRGVNTNNTQASSVKIPRVQWYK